jgi:hypothetical protein
LGLTRLSDNMDGKRTKHLMAFTRIYPISIVSTALRTTID